VILTIQNPKGGDVEIGIYDLLGKKVREFTLSGAKEGKIKWDATDASGNTVSSGVYFAKATNNANSAHIKLIYLK
jgi:flagellar hook assembly protein FlgD